MKKLFKALIVLEDGKIFKGLSTKKINCIGEIVFTTSMTGYQKALTDPSYRDQILVMTYPIQGNYGTNKTLDESNSIQVKGFIIKELTDLPSHWQSQQTLKSFLDKQKIPFITDVDTRALTRHLRKRGTMMGSISSESDVSKILKKIKSHPKYGSEDIVSQVSTTKIFKYSGNKKNENRIIIIDLGVKNNIKRILKKLGCEVIVMPHTSNYEEIIKLSPQGIILSPGPGDPMKIINLSDVIKKLSKKYPILGICLGHQLLGLAYGAKSYKLPYGNRGSNHPVIDQKTNKVFITSQNHGYAINQTGLDKNMTVAQVNLNDGHIEALKHKKLPVSSIQYHPEASPGPKDTEFIFNNFLNEINEFKEKNK
ncbi:MAG: glutamine-hydrolyzing carbamoyl-phosphate synthase small subunit [Dehalococcoidia bacterium]|nr:glutamine-hydrolyzing carbamoyl-phosphate synthase small subunit [Dehalococcoidia bacterium]